MNNASPAFLDQRGGSPGPPAAGQCLGSVKLRRSASAHQAALPPQVFSTPGTMRTRGDLSELSMSETKRVSHVAGPAFGIFYRAVGADSHARYAPQRPGRSPAPLRLPPADATWWKSLRRLHAGRDRDALVTPGPERLLAQATAYLLRVALARVAATHQEQSGFSRQNRRR